MNYFQIENIFIQEKSFFSFCRFEFQHSWCEMLWKFFWLWNKIFVPDEVIDANAFKFLRLSG